MHKIFMQTLTFVLFTFLAANFALAQGGFSEADADNDQKVDHTELEEYVSGKLGDFDRFDELLDKLDTDCDGSISSDEFDNRMNVIQDIMSQPAHIKKDDEAKPENKPETVVEFAERYDRMFADRDPQVGSILENASGFDEEGNPFELDQTRGKYTVFVFGCLT